MTNSAPVSANTHSDETITTGPESRRERDEDASRRRAWVGLATVVLLGIFVYFPTLRTPFLLDDYLQSSMIEGHFPGKRGPFDLYDFINDVDRPRLVERGMLPWWAHPALEIRFFRPLASGVRWVEHHAFGASPVLMHLHSLVWWFAVVFFARALFRRALAPRAATIATVIFALAPCHAIPLAWLANREALLSLTFGFAALGALLRFRDEGRLRDAALATALFALSLLSGEYAIGFGGYVLALELAGRRATLVRRAASVSTFALPAAAYLVARAAGHYGSFGSGFYTDPFRETGAFLRAAPGRLVTLLAEGWFSLDGDTLTHRTPGYVLVLVALVAAPLLVVPIRREIAALDAERRSSVTWLVLGSILCLAPVLAVVPAPRVLGASMLGVSPAVALLLERAWFSAPLEPSRGVFAELTPVVALILGFAHLVHGPATSWLMSNEQQKSAESFARASAELRAGVKDPERAEVFVVRCLASAFFLPFALDEHGRLPARWRVLAQTGHVLALRRDARTFDLLASAEQGLFPMGQGALFRSADAPIARGQVFVAPGMRVTILDVGPHGPRSARFELDRDVESSSLTWITEDAKKFSFVELPALGFGKPFDP